MRKQMLVSILALLLIGLLSTGAMAQTNVLVYVNGKKVDFPDQQPYIDKNNRTMVPVRFVSEALDAKVDWNPISRKVDIQRDNRHIVLTINQRNYLVNGQTQTMDTEAVITPLSRTMVPVRFVAEGLGAVVRWDVVGVNGVVHNFTLGQSDAEIEKIINNVRNELGGGVVDSNKYEVVKGYTIPKETNMRIDTYNTEYNPNNVDIALLLRMQYDMEVQFLQTYDILASKFGNQLASEVDAYIRQKTKSTIELKHKDWKGNGKTIRAGSTWGDWSIAITVWN